LTNGVAAAVSDETATGELLCLRVRGRSRAGKGKYRQKRRDIMSTKQKQNLNRAKPKAEANKKIVDVDVFRKVVEFKVRSVVNGKEERAFGGGAFKQEDIRHIIAELSEFARQLELSDAEARGYWRAFDTEYDIPEQNDNDDEQQDNQDE
jgi:hypothetical protein